MKIDPATWKTFDLADLTNFFPFNFTKLNLHLTCDKFRTKLLDEKE